MRVSAPTLDGGKQTYIVGSDLCTNGAYIDVEQDLVIHPPSQAQAHLLQSDICCRLQRHKRMPSACASGFWMELMSMGLQQRAPRMGSIQHLASCLCASADVAWVVQVMRRPLRTERKRMLSSTERGKRGVSSLCLDFGWAHTSSLGTCYTISPLPHGVTIPILGAGSVRCLSCVTLTDCSDRAGPRRGGLSLSAHRARAALCASAARQLAGALQSTSAHSALCCHRVHSQVCTLPCIIVARYGHLLKLRPYNTSNGRRYTQNEKHLKNFKGVFLPNSACRAQIRTQILQRNFATSLYRNCIIGVQIVACYYVLR